jgi:hypothetical protein
MRNKDPKHRAAAIQGFIDIAHWYEVHPEIPLPELALPNYAVSDPDIVALALGNYEKKYDDDLITVTKMFGPIAANFIFMREQWDRRKETKEPTITDPVEGKYCDNCVTPIKCSNASICLNKADIPF